ncbi:endonuclease/exonuclease/phosphatase family metal-dependent hydrolase [Pseudomonas nitritireducens]|uniref:Endonuclease/exonuclease/phosphatase family metal-dependent hydrolase n=1 Tax=Pseudomonas nitroreducens TaxID=46680 RepID=A0A7W7NYY0_PSENT|nr:endonuclease/exonuclease/phosphatase family protein [Pseudomonas nitritireducens]MBB4862178.1 endonuclease/exonuclease/phosphatase family metal-dependent hydrolase [Pseudomonas nitritireducens]
MSRAEAAPLGLRPAQAVTLLRVLTVNTHKGFNAFNRRFILHELRDAVRATSADLVFLQEVHGEHQLHAERQPDWPPRPQYEFLADSMWPAFAYGRNAVYPEGHHGNALLSRLPIRRWDNRDVSVAGTEERGLLHAQIELPDGRDLHAVCVHLGLHESQRQQQLRLLCSLVDELPADAPVLVAGDFNDWRCRAGAVLAGCGLQAAFPEPGGAPRSFPARWPLLRLDRIYVRHLKVTLSEVLHRKPWPHLSDHLPLLAEVCL